MTRCQGPGETQLWPARRVPLEAPVMPRGPASPVGLQGKNRKPLMSPRMWETQRRAWLGGDFEKAQKPLLRRLVASGGSSGRRAEPELYWGGGVLLPFKS